MVMKYNKQSSIHIQKTPNSQMYVHIENSKENLQKLVTTESTTVFDTQHTRVVCTGKGDKNISEKLRKMYSVSSS